MRSKVDRWMLETDDIILKGSVAGHESSRWAKEIAAGRAYPGREAYKVTHRKENE